MKVIDLFAGIGGFSLAAHWMGWETVAFVEWDAFCQKVLKKNFPNVPVYGDIKEFDGKQFKGAIDLICGGFPCQPFSVAGQRKGKDDDRYLWPQMLRVIREVQPTWVIGENVAGILSMDNGNVLEQIQADLEGEGYEVQSFVIPACSTGAPHRRDRVWIIAYASQRRWRQTYELQYLRSRKPYIDSYDSTIIANANRSNGRGNNRIISKETEQEKIQKRQQIQFPCKSNSRLATKPYGKQDNSTKSGGFHTQSICTNWSTHWYEIATQLCRVDDGISKGLDEIERISTKPKEKTSAGRAKRLKALGNAIVPQVAYEIFKAINHHERH